MFVGISAFDLQARCPICGHIVYLNLGVQLGPLLYAFNERRTLYSAYLTKQQAERAALSTKSGTRKLVNQLASVLASHMLPVRLEIEKAGYRLRFPKVKAHSHG